MLAGAGQGPGAGSQGRVAGQGRTLGQGRGAGSQGRVGGSSRARGELLGKPRTTACGHQDCRDGRYVGAGRLHAAHTAKMHAGRKKKTSLSANQNRLRHAKEGRKPTSKRRKEINQTSLRTQGFRRNRETNQISRGLWMWCMTRKCSSSSYLDWSACLCEFNRTSQESEKSSSHAVVGKQEASASISSP